MHTLFLTVMVLGVVFLLVSRKKKEKAGGNWVQFYTNGKEAGFSLRETEMLRQLTVQCELEYPNAIFESQTQLDRCIQSLVRSAGMANSGQETHEFLSKLFDYRKQVELHASSIKNSITDSRKMHEGQALRVLVQGLGVFKSRVVKNTNNYMTISRPIHTKGGSSSINWTGRKIAVYFWREDDAGYVFDSEVLDEVFSKGVPSIKITQGDSLFRTQKRMSIRAKLHKAAFLYVALPFDPPYKIETKPGIKCYMEDISDTGCAIVIGGQAHTNLRVKVQFELGNTVLCMTGTICSANYQEETKRSLLHIEAEPMPVEIRNIILAEIFGSMSGDDEDELPMRLSDEEFAGVDSDEESAGINSDEDSSIDMVEPVMSEVGSV